MNALKVSAVTDMVRIFYCLSFVRVGIHRSQENSQQDSISPSWEGYTTEWISRWNSKIFCKTKMFQIDYENNVILLTLINVLGPVVLRPAKAIPGLNFNPSFFSSKAFLWQFSLFYLEHPLQKIVAKENYLNLPSKLSYLNSHFRQSRIILTQLWTTRP